MRRLGSIAATLLALTAALTVASATLAKGEDVVATLDTALPTDAEPGSEIEIGWTLTVTEADGSVVPYIADGVFVRLLPSLGDAIEVAGRQDRAGHYVAIVTVPRGGLGDVEIGLRGTACTDGRCERTDEMVAIARATVGVGVGAAADRSPAVNRATDGGPAPTAAPTGISLVPATLIALAAAAVVAGIVARHGRVRTRARSTRS